jgi:GT2 family glycosyltransferase
MSGGEVTAIVPVWNRRDLVERALGGLRAQTRPVAEVVVVDDGSQDGSAELAESLGARTIRMGSHGGFARAVNRGVRECRTPLVAVVNNDVELAPDWLERLVRVLEDPRRPGGLPHFATGRILRAGDPQRIDATYDALCRGGTAWRVGNGRLDGPAFQEPREIGFAPFTAALFRAELFEKIGLLDERFESYLEDVDFGLRCAVAGCAGRYVPDAIAWHEGSATLGTWHAETTRRIARNQVFLISKHYSRRMIWRYGWPILVAQGLWCFTAVRHGRGWACIQGKAQGLRRWSEVREPLPYGRGSEGRAAEVLCAGEREIRRVQRESGQDWYWRLYFLLTPGGAK